MPDAQKENVSVKHIALATIDLENIGKCFMSVKHIALATIDSEYTGEHRTSVDHIKHPINSVGMHYSGKWRNCISPKLQFSFMDRQLNTVRRKISEAIKIVRNKPNSNEREKLASTFKFLNEGEKPILCKMYIMCL